MNIISLALPKSGLVLNFRPVNPLNPDGSSNVEFGIEPDVLLPKRGPNGNDPLSPKGTCLQYIRGL